MEQTATSPAFPALHVYRRVCCEQALVGYGRLAMSVNQLDKGMPSLLKAMVVQQVTFLFFTQRSCTSFFCLPWSLDC